LSVVAAVALSVAACGGAPPVTETRVTASFPEFVGPEVLLTPAEGRARLKKAKALKEKAYLYVVVTPPEAEIKVDGSVKGTGTAYVTEGKNRFRLLTLTAEGYGRVDGFVELEERQVTKLRVALRRAGALTALTDPAGAEVAYDGIPAGHTPVTLRDLEPGTHRIEMALGAWRFAKDVEIEARGTQVVSETVPEDLAKAPAEAAAAPVVAFAPQAPPPPPAKPQAAKQVTVPAPAPAAPPPPPPAPVAALAPPPPPPPPPLAASAPPRAGTRPDCGAVCDRYGQALGGTESFRDLVRDRCRARCEGGDLRFSICAWKSRTPDDVTACAALPEAAN
jgi:hypothetical protein